VLLQQVYVKNKLLQENMIDVYHEITARAVAWKCRKEKRVEPKADSEVYNELLREVSQHEPHVVHVEITSKQEPCYRSETAL
jgi:hypothetical protein